MRDVPKVRYARAMCDDIYYHTDTAADTHADIVTLFP
jgi:hypothetical protein